MGFVILVLLALAASHCHGQSAQTAAAKPPAFAADTWPEADALFRGDKHWVGGDGAYSIDLGGGRVLWTFGDSFVDPTGARSRKSPGAKMVSNTVAIQRGYDPSAATMEFAWRTDGDKVPAAFFADHESFRYWPGQGVRVRDHLIIFLMKVKSAPGGLGFDVYDWDAVLVRNPDAAPPDWDVTALETPENDMKVIVGSASVLVEGDFAYAFSSQETQGHSIYLVRWPIEDFYAGRLDGMQWWCDNDAWAGTQEDGPRPVPVMKDAATEFTVHADAESRRYLQVQTQGFGSAVIAMRDAAAFTGPWSPKQTLYRPPEFDKPRIMIYSGKAHPHLKGADLVLTYSTNSFDFSRLVDDPDIYFPRFVRLSRK